MRTYNEIDNDLHKAEVNIKNIKTGKQDKLTAGDGIQIVNNVISATGGGGGGNNTYEHKIKIVFNSPNSTQEEIYLSILSTHETDYTTIRDIAHNIAWNRYIGANAAFTGTAGVPFIGTSVRFIDLGDGEFGICVFTPYVTVNLYCYGGEGTDDAWPGVEATATAVAQPVSYYVSAVKLVGYEMQGSAIYALEGWVPGNDWGEGSPNKTSVAESDGSYLITFDTPAKMETTDLDLPNATIKVQIIDFIDETNFWADGNKVEGGSNVAKVPADAKDKTYTLVVTYSAEGNTAELK